MSAASLYLLAHALLSIAALGPWVLFLIMNNSGKWPEGAWAKRAKHHTFLWGTFSVLAAVTSGIVWLMERAA